MSWWARMRNRGRIEDELDAELHDHVERQVTDHVRAGMSAGEARRRARLEFGGLDQVKEMCRDARGTRWLEDTWQDLRFAVRLLVKERWSAAAAVLALGLGIGLTGAAFTVYNAVLVRGLPVDDPERIMTLGTRDAAGNEQGVSYLDFQDWRAAATSFDDIAAYSEPAMNVGDPDMATERFFGARVTANAFRLIGVEPLLGRDFSPADDRPGTPAVVMLGHRMWTNRYGADPEVLGRVIRVNDAPATVVGVMPADFAFPQWAELWQPLGVTPGLADHARDRRVFRTVGRLADGMTVSRARADLDTVAAALAATHPDTNQGFQPWLDPFNEHYNGTLRPVLTALLAAAGVVLLVACANGANLLLARASRRSREVGMRVALGATRARIVRQLLVECLLLAGLAGVLGLGLAALCSRLLSTGFEPLTAPYWIDFGLDGRVLAFVIVTCLSTTVIFGLAPALHTSKANMRSLVTAAGRVGTAGRLPHRWMGWLVTAELALTLVLLAGAGLMARSLLTIALANRVIDTADVTTVQLFLPEDRYPTADQRAAFFRALDEQAAADPTIASATHAGAIPFAPIAASHALAVDGRSASDGDPLPTAGVITVADDYFEALGLRLQRGRPFTDRDGTAGNDSVIVNRRLADRFFPNEDPLGRRIRLTARGETDEESAWLTIVGISPTVRQTLSGAPGPVAYRPYRAESIPFQHLLVRGVGGTDAAGAARETVRKLDPDLPIARVWTLDGVLAQTGFIPHLIGSLLGAFAWVALVLSAVGLYGVTAYAANQRTQEIGLRMALGAGTGQVGWMVLRRGLVQLGAGLAIGIWGALTVGRLFESWLVDTAPADPVTQASVAVLLGGVAIVACLLPARRAARLDPMVALRHE